MSEHRYSLNEKITLCPNFDKCVWFERKTGESFPSSNNLKCIQTRAVAASCAALKLISFWWNPATSSVVIAVLASGVVRITMSALKLICSCNHFAHCWSQLAVYSVNKNNQLKCENKSNLVSLTSIRRARGIFLLCRFFLFILFNILIQE